MKTLNQLAEELAQTIRNRQHVYRYKGGGALTIHSKNLGRRVKLQNQSRLVSQDFSISG